MSRRANPLRARHPTLRGRVSLLALAVIAGWLAVLATVFNVVLARRLDAQVNDTLRIRAQAASATLHVAANGTVTVGDSATDGELDTRLWVYAGTRAVERPRGTPSVQAAADRLAATGPAYSDHAREARFYALPIRHNGTQVATVVAAVSTGPYHRAEHAALLGSLLASLAVLAGAYPVLRIAATRALRPVDDMSRQAADWSAHSPTQRFGGSPRFEELRELAVNLDALLDRLSAVLRHERQLSAELSHELRTPLAHITAEVDLALSQNSPGVDHPAALLRIRERAEAMDGIIETLLTTARAELDGSPGACALDPVLGSVVSRVDSPIEVRYDASTLTAGVDRPRLERIIWPILDNAVRYARSKVWIEARRLPRGIVIDIANDGPELDGALTERIFEPGFRADTADHHSGVGLGLALARRLARAVDGDVSVLPTQGRTTFRVNLPPA